MEQICTAGFARLDITPPLGSYMIGGEERYVKGVRDPLYVNAVAFGQGEKSAVLLVCDLLGMYGDFGDSWPAEIAEKVGVDKASMMLCCTHTHTGPAPNTGEMYFEWLFRRLCDAAVMAMNDRKPVVDVRWAQGMTENLTFVRRYWTKDGRVVSHTKFADPILDRPAGTADETVRLVRILREDAPEIALVNFQLHPDNINGKGSEDCEYCSADYPGALRDTVENVHKNVQCVFLDGAEGQLASKDRMKPFFPNSHAFAVEIGRKLADVVLELFPKCVSTGRKGLRSCQRIVSMQINPDAEPGRIPECFTENIPGNVTAVSFCGLGLVGLPGEPYCEVGQQIREQSGHPVSMVACQCNGAHGYFPMASNYDEPGGGYSVSASHVKKGTAEQLVQEAVELLNS